MLEVSAAGGAEDANTPQTSRKAARSATTKKPSRATATPRATTSPATAARESGARAAKASSSRTRSTRAKRTPDNKPSQAVPGLLPPGLTRATATAKMHPPASAAPARRRPFAIAATAGLVVATLALVALPSNRPLPSDAAARTDALAPSVAASTARPEKSHALAAARADASATPHAEVPKAVVEKPRPRRDVTTGTKSTVDSASSDAASPVVAAAETAVVAATVVSPEPTPAVPPPGVSQEPDRSSAALVTLTGCLESTVEGDQFRLTDTQGADAPRARGWRSGFLKKRSAPVALVEPPDRMLLQQHVGHRVVATGQLTNRDLHLRTLDSAGASCD